MRWHSKFALAVLLIFGSCIQLDKARAQVAWVRNDNDLLSAKVVLRCFPDTVAIDDRDLGPFTVMLHSSLTDTAPEVGKMPEVAGFPAATFGGLVVYVSVKGSLAPLVLRQSAADAYEYHIGCSAANDRSENARYYPTLVLGSVTDVQKRELMAALKDRAESSRLSGYGSTLLMEPPVLVDLPAQAATYGDLLASFFAASKPSGWLSWFAGTTQIQMVSQSFDFTPVTVGAGVVAAEKQVGAAFPAPRLQRRRDIKITLAGSPLASQDLAAAGAVDTFGYCGRVVKDVPTAPAPAAGGGTAPKQPPQAAGFVLEDCALDGQGEIPLRLFRLEPIRIKPAAQGAVRLYPLLRVAAYRVPYPYAWQNSAADMVDVTSDSLELSLKRKIALSQSKGSTCDVQHSLSADDALSQSLTFPAPPCRAVDFVFAGGPFAGARPVVTAGCRPVAHGPLPVSEQGAIRCFVPALERGTDKRATISVQWSAAFDPMVIPYTVDPKGDGSVSIALEQLLTGMKLRTALLRSTERRTDSPVYRPVSVRYAAGQQPCGDAFEIGGAAGAPSIAASKCKRMPTRADITYEIDTANSDPSVSIDAFARQLVHPLDVARHSGATTGFDATKAKLSLPVAFSGANAKKYAENFVQPAELMLKGPRLYSQPDCRDVQGQKPLLVQFEGRSKAEHQWPVYGRVLDNDGKPLTNCAPAYVERSADGSPYLTFAFSSMRALGPRRLLIVARSQEMMDRRGFPTALETAVKSLVKAAVDANKKGAPLSPLDVISASQDGNFRTLFTGEEAALEPQTAEDRISDFDRVAPRTVDFSVLTLLPEVKNAEQIVVIMDGSQFSEDSANKAGFLSTKLAARGERGRLQFLLSSESSCGLWRKLVPQIECSDLGGMKQSDREKQLSDAMQRLLIKAK